MRHFFDQPPLSPYPILKEGWLSNIFFIHSAIYSMLPYHCVGMIFLLYFVSTVFNLMFIISLLGRFRTAGLSLTVFVYILLGQQMGKELPNAMFTTFLSSTSA